MKNQLSPLMKEKLSKLTPKERKYFRVMWSKYGVLYITSKPGIAKSAIGKSIADKMGFKYESKWLSMSDESDFMYPFLTDKEYNGESIKVSGYAVPKWAYEVNNQPTIIHFEELNRASLPVRNAALQILLERSIGEFKFNDNVIMMASGNLGEEDGTDVEELDAALNNRLIHIEHTLSVDEWINGFAKENCHPMITSFIKSYPEKMYQAPNNNSKAYATPRSWTMLSEYIVSNFGMNSSAMEFLSDTKEVAFGYVGNSALKFIQYCENMLKISLQDVLDNYDSIKDELSKYNRDKNSELLQSLKEIDINKLSDKQLNNVVKFLKGIGDDEKMSYILHVLDNYYINPSDGVIKKFVLNFRDLLENIQSLKDKC